MAVLKLTNPSLLQLTTNCRSLLRLSAEVDLSTQSELPVISIDKQIINLRSCLILWSPRLVVEISKELYQIAKSTSLTKTTTTQIRSTVCLEEKIIV